MLQPYHLHFALEAEMDMKKSMTVTSKATSHAQTRFAFYRLFRLLCSSAWHCALSGGQFM